MMPSMYKDENNENIGELIGSPFAQLADEMIDNLDTLYDFSPEWFITYKKRDFNPESLQDDNVYYTKNDRPN